MRAFLLHADAVVRADVRRIDFTAPGRTLASLMALIVEFGGLYGAAMGSFGGVTGDRLLQVGYAAVKVPMLLLITSALSLPSFFIFSTLLGLRSDLAHSLRALASSQAGLTVLLASLAPFTLLWNVSSPDHTAAILFNAGMFGAATLGGQALLRRHYGPLLQRDPRHRLLLRLWGMMYAFVGIQMGWILRPFVADPNRPVAFFREDTWGNAYVILAQMIHAKLFR
jgi:hypothetical protein